MMHRNDMRLWYRMTVDDVLTHLGSSAGGLDDAEVAARRALHGPNELRERRGKSPWRMLFEQFTETMVLILILAAVVSGLLGKGVEAIAIAIIVVLFGVLGFVQEYRAERAIAALKKMASPRVRVRRLGIPVELPAADLVPGDIVLLEAGNLVPADLRIFESASLRIQEAALTGESEPVEKQADPMPEAELPLGDRTNMAYLGTSVTYGRGTAVVTETAMQTELGRIASMIQDVASEPTPLQKRLSQVGKTLAAVGVASAGLVFLIGLLRHEPAADMFLTAISVAVAVVPEGLPAVVTISLAIGAQRMLRRNALIRRLPAVETLGSVTVICSDKTGTLTENRMTVTVLDAAGHRLTSLESMHLRRPMMDEQDRVLPGPEEMGVPLRVALTIAALCNDAVLRPDARPGALHALGDPTEGALLIAAAKAGLLQDELRKSLPRIAEFPFDSQRKRMTTVHRCLREDSIPWRWADVGGASPPAACSFTKGAVDGLLDISSHVLTENGPEPLDEPTASRIQATHEEMARNGLRVIGFAYRVFGSVPEDRALDLELDVVFAGMAGMIDPPRAEVLPAIRICRAAGIRPVMITGDHPLTASAIARDLELSAGEEPLTGKQLSTMNDEELGSAVERTSVFARVSPEEKLRLVDALQRQGSVVAMTGDGVNDSPALKKADIGVAMGITGTDVAKEASDMVLLDDNFATIVAAVEEGRVIFDNLMRFVKFSLGGNLGKVLVMLGAPLIGVNVALRPLQLLWLNLLTDGLLGIGLSLEPAEPDAMQRPPRLSSEPILNRTARMHVGWVGVFIAAITLSVGLAFLDAAGDGEAIWQTMVFATLGFTQIGHALGLRAAGRAPLSIRSNPAMMALTVLTVGLQLAVIYVPFLDRFFALAPLPLSYLALSMGLGVLTFLGVLVERHIRSRHLRSASAQ